METLGSCVAREKVDAEVRGIETKSGRLGEEERGWRGNEPLIGESRACRL